MTLVQLLEDDWYLLHRTGKHSKVNYDEEKLKCIACTYKMQVLSKRQSEGILLGQGRSPS